MKVPRCKHIWNIYFRGDPLTCSWMCEVEEECKLCGKKKTRAPTDNELQKQIAFRLCPDCGIRKDEHVDKTCVKILALKVADLTQRLESLEDWRSR